MMLDAGAAQAQTVPAPATESGDDANTIVVTAHAYKPVDPSPAAKVQADNHDLPITVDQVTGSLLADRAVVSTDEAIDTVAGVRLIPGFPGSSGFLIRGFFETYNSLVDGYRDQAGLVDPQGIERFDILKGPPSVLFGSQSAGGVVDIVTKSPTPVAGYNLDVLGGSRAERRFTVDLNQPLAGGRVLTRLNATYDDADGFRDFSYTRARLIAPAVLVNVTSADTLLIKGDYDEYDFNAFADYPLGAVTDAQFLKAPISRNLSEPGLPGATSHEWRVSGDENHRFGNGWRLHTGFAYNAYRVTYGLSRVYGASLEANGRTVDRTLGSGPQYNNSLTAQEELFGTFATGPVKHDFVAGVEYYRQNYHYIVDFTPIAPLDLFNPVYGARPGATAFGFAGGSGDHSFGQYVQDLASIDTHVKLLVGVRHDRDVAYYGSENAKGVRTFRATDINTAWSPRAGIVYQPVKATSLYFSWSKSFYPQIFYYTADNSVLPPDRGEQYEIGVKQDLFDRRLTLTAAIYHLDRENVATPDPRNNSFYINSGKQGSRGLELSAVGQLAKGLNLQATYAYTDAKVLRDNFLTVGQRLGGVPRHAASLFAQYEAPSGRLRGAGAGVGLFYASNREATIPNTFALGSYARIDALAYYRVASHYRLGVNVKNLNDVRYFETDGGYAARPAEPRTVLASLRAEF